MCLIIAQGRDTKRVSFQDFDCAAENNEDGMGFMWVKDGKLRVVTQIGNITGFYQKYCAAHDTGSPIVTHFRMATSGNRGQNNVHPFYLAKDLAFCHNGILPYDAKDDRSDTRVFADQVLRQLPKGWLYNEAMRELLGIHIGTDKLVFMDATGKIIIINEGNGHWEGDIWYSNHSHCYKWSATHYTSSGRGKHTERRASFQEHLDDEEQWGRSQQTRWEEDQWEGFSDPYYSDGRVYCYDDLPIKTGGLPLYAGAFPNAPVECCICGKMLEISPSGYTRAQKQDGKVAVTKALQYMQGGLSA